MSKKLSSTPRAVTSALIVAGAVIIVPASHARNAALDDWRTVYPNSNSDDAGCQLCHSSSTSQLNTYGKDLCVQNNGTVPSDWSANIAAIGSLDSDQDPGAVDNATEIANNTQPGWTTTTNPLYEAGFPCAEVAQDSSVPAGVPTPYDLAVAGDPVANAGGPYQALVGDVVTLDGSGSTDDGTIIGWFWDFGDGAAGTGEMTTHTYNAAATYTVTLQVVDDEGNASTDQTTATISDAQLLDLDIRRFSASKTSRVGRDVTIKLTVDNGGEVQAQAIATVTGLQNGIEVYNERLNVFDDIGKGATSFRFPVHQVDAQGDIEWTVTIADGDADDDTAVSVTTVK
jgi:hypothetical protein